MVGITLFLISFELSVLMKKLYTAAEIAQKRLPGLPTTKSSILARAAKEGWRYEEQYGIGGIRKVFEIPDRYLLPGQMRPEVVSARQDLAEYLADDKGNVQNQPVAVLDESKLALAARIVEEWLDREKLVLAHERKGSLIAILYKLVSCRVLPEDLLRLMCELASVFNYPAVRPDGAEGPVSESDDS